METPKHAEVIGLAPCRRCMAPRRCMGIRRAAGARRAPGRERRGPLAWLVAIRIRQNNAWLPRQLVGAPVLASISTGINQHWRQQSDAVPAAGTVPWHDTPMRPNLPNASHRKPSGAETNSLWPRLAKSPHPHACTLPLRDAILSVARFRFRYCCCCQVSSCGCALWCAEEPCTAVAPPVCRPVPHRLHLLQ